MYDGTSIVWRHGRSSYCGGSGCGRRRMQPGRPALRVNVAQERSPEQLRSVLVDELGVGMLRSAEIDVIPVVSGIIQNAVAR